AQSLVRAAARNNAEWCAVMSGAHGVPNSFGPQSWTAPTRTPPYYPDAVTLVPDADPTELLNRIDLTAPGATIKDSFADLDLKGAGFHILFEAQWIHRPTSAPAVASDVPWNVVDTAAALSTWASAWDNGQGNADLFHPELLIDPAIIVLAGHATDGTVIAGGVASRSDHVVGISNVFARNDDLDTAWPLVLNAARTLFPTHPLVGYEHTADLEAALHHGFEPIGALRIWLCG
ncbi:hypothetical protein, partial [Streptomyces sp. H28]|uniref:hypothetical protein n=2 Tax=Streptomyces sp. H28 TaxID=2775865 RepID=UPI001CE0BFFC